MVELGVGNSKGCVPTEFDERVGVGSMWASRSPRDPAAVAEDSLLAAEESAEQVLNCVHPTLDSEERREDVIDYIQQLVKSRLLCEVVSYGSVPLKTYLPEGDIDLTVLKGPNSEETLIYDVLAVIQEEENNQNSEYEVRETQFIDAEVKLVKCLVRNIVIDISCHQLGGLSTLCFLEQVDRFVGRNHLFKRSIILVKAWCYYESRILGAHHGLISTYALETLVLYMFHFFHSSFRSPLSMFHCFLDYYSKFDWDNYCISLKGPVCRSALPDIIVDLPNRPSHSLLFSEEFLESCAEMFSSPCKELEGNSKPFQIKHLNIMDPLKENNNLGRSVNRGNFYRIRSALKLGACKLGQILSQSREEVGDEIQGFFANTCGLHGQQDRSNDVAIDIGDKESTTPYSSSPAVLSSEDGMLVKPCSWDHDNVSVCWEPESYRMREGSLEMASESTCTTSSSTVTQLLENLDCREEIDSISVDEGSEFLDALADLTGDYDSHIRSLLRGQLCHGFSMPPHSVSSPASPSPSGLRLLKPWDASFGMNNHSLSSHDSTFCGANFQFEWHQKAQGIGTYFPKVNVFQMERAFHGRGRRKVFSTRNHHSNGFFQETARSKFQGWKQKPDATSKSPPPPSIPLRPEKKGHFGVSCRIEFGSFRSLSPDMIPSSIHDSLRKQPVTAKESSERQSISHQLDEEEFPPLAVSCIR